MLSSGIVGVIGHRSHWLGHRIIALMDENFVGFQIIVSTMIHLRGKNNVLSNAVKALISPLVQTLFLDGRKYLFLLKQVVHVGANNSPLLSFLPKIDMLDKVVSLPSTGFSCRFITSS